MAEDKTGNHKTAFTEFAKKLVVAGVPSKFAEFVKAAEGTPKEVAKFSDQLSDALHYPHGPEAELKPAEDTVQLEMKNVKGETVVFTVAKPEVKVIHASHFAKQPSIDKILAKKVQELDGLDDLDKVL